MNKYPGFSSGFPNHPKHRFFDGNVHSPSSTFNSHTKTRRTPRCCSCTRSVNVSSTSFATRTATGSALDRREMLKASYEWADEIDSKDQSIRRGETWSS